MVARFLELRAIGRLGYRLETLDSFELGCFAVIEGEFSRQRELEMKKPKGG